MSADKKVVARGPILDVGGGISIDCRYIDRVELASRFSEPGGLRLIIGYTDLEVSLEFPGTVEQAEDLIVAIAPYTRAAPLTSDVDYADAEDLRDSIFEGRYQPPPIVRVNGEPVTVEDGLISTGMVAWVVDDVLDAAQKGLDIELADKSSVPAAIFLLAIQATKPPPIEPLSDRLREFRDIRRRRDPS